MAEQERHAAAYAVILDERKACDESEFVDDIMGLRLRFLVQDR